MYAVFLNNGKKERIECFEDYIPWERKVDKKKLEKSFLSIGIDEGIRVKAIMNNGKYVKLFMNKTGEEYIMTIINDDNSEEVFSYRSSVEAYNFMKSRISQVEEVVLY